jgi:recombination protein RecT
MKKQFSSTLPSHVSPAKFMRSAVTAVQNTPDLQECEVNSIISSCQKAAVDGLIFDGREAAMVTFNKKIGNKWVKEAQYMPMVAGILKKARNSGQISAISAHVVYQNDQFDYELGLEPKLTHKPVIDGEPGELRCAYAIAKLKDGSTQFEVMTRPQIEEIMKSSKAGWDDKAQQPRGIWKKWESEMWRKTALKRLAKYLPSSSDLEGIIEYDNKEFGLADDHDAPEPTPAPKEVKDTPHESKPTKAAAAVMAQAEDISDGEIIDDAPPLDVDDTPDDLI